jgi:isopentenyl-diphosphate delta-isomerase
MHPAQRADEVFDLVDEHDQVIGQATRAEVHAKGLYHRAVHVLLFNSEGKVFLQKRSMFKDTAPGCWDSSASGHVDRGEVYTETAVRECREELGVEVENLKKLAKLPPGKANGFEFVEIYTGKHEGPFELNPAEIVDGKWYCSSEVDAALEESPESYALSFRQVWECWRSR